MGRSTETFSKKEREKKKSIKLREKKEKAEDRKANSDKGKSLDDMMAYIDENGNITSTPPDPMKKKVSVLLPQPTVVKKSLYTLQVLSTTFARTMK